MSDAGKPLQPEHVFKRVVWRSTLAMGAALEQATTWTITGLAAIVGVVIANLHSISEIVSTKGIRVSLGLFTLSLLAGAASKTVGMAVQSGLNTISELEALLNSEAGVGLMNRMHIEGPQLISEIADPFGWPLNVLIRRSGKRGLHDYLSSDKRMVRLFCVQLYLNALHGLAALAAVVVLACAIK